VYSLAFGFSRSTTFLVICPAIDRSELRGNTGEAPKSNHREAREITLEREMPITSSFLSF
jgi:hypothetical protein